MTSKQTSRVCDDGRPQRQQSQTSAVASLEASRRTSRTSSCEDMHSVMASSSTSQSTDDKQKDDQAIHEMGSYGRSAEVDILRSGMSDTNFASNLQRTLSSASPSGAREFERLANFGIVLPGVYRSSYPLSEHFDFCTTLGLRTVVTLVNKQDERSANLGAFVQSNGIRHVIFNMQGTKKEDIPHHTMQAILGVVLDKSCYPLLIHCNQGKHRTGCVVAAARKVAGWPVNTVLQEYRSFAEPKVRECDVEYISALEVASLEVRTSEASRVPWTMSRYPTRRRNFLHFVAFTVGTMMLFWCSSLRWRM